MWLLGQCTQKEYEELLRLYGEDKVQLASETLIESIENLEKMSLDRSFFTLVRLDYELVEIANNINFHKLVKYDELLEEAKVYFSPE